MEVLRSDHKRCIYCGGGLSEYSRDAQVTLYTRTGPVEAVHIELTCKDRSCRKSYRYGFHHADGIIYEEPFKRKYLVTCRRTAFEIVYLYEVVLMIYHGQVSFAGVANIYNSLHYLAIKKDMERYALYEKRVSRAFFVFALIDTSQRYKIPITFDIDSIDTTLKKYYESLHLLIQERWGFHQCDKPGCGRALVIDGGLKPQRKLCAARTAGIYKYRHSSNTTVVGCTRIPTVGKKFCNEHSTSNVPSVPANQLNTDNVRKLRSTVKQQKTEKTEDDIFTVKGLHGRKKVKGGVSYLVEWVGYAEKTWEISSNIPKFIRDFYERTGKCEIPKPRVKTVKKAGTAVYYLLSWDGTDEADQFVPQEDFAIEEDVDEHSSSCNTMKHHGAKFCHSSAGILIGCYPCGVIPLFSELYGSESISQVFGHVADFIGEVKPSNLEYLLYDDACHLGPYSTNYINSKSKSQTEATKVMGGLKHLVDKLHFKGHKGSWCHANCNPYTDTALKSVNTVICEQTFKSLNKYTNVKAMNEFRFQFFFSYVIDLHNLHSIGQLHLSHPTGLGANVADAPTNITKNISPEKILVCELCGKKDFGTKRPKNGLSRHMISAHGIKLSKKPAFVQDCDQLANKVSTKSGGTKGAEKLLLVQDCDQPANEVNTKSGGGEGSDKLPLVQDCDKPVHEVNIKSGDYCDPITKILKDLAIEGASSSGTNIKPDSPVICAICLRKDFKSRQGLSHHMQSVHKTTLQTQTETSKKCTHCDRTFSNQSGLTRHFNMKHKHALTIRAQ